MIDTSSNIAIKEQLKLFRSKLWDLLVATAEFNENILDKYNGKDVEIFAEEILIAGFDVNTV